MPYKIKKRKNGWVRINKDTGKVKAHHKTKKKALAAIRAIHANESLSLMKLLLEDPNRVWFGPSKRLTWRDPDAYTFAYYKGDFEIEIHTTHEELFWDVKSPDKYKREILETPGRLWCDRKVISFWKNPTKSQLKKLIKDIAQSTNIKITGDWWIEYEEQKFQHIDTYLGYERKNVDMKTPHEISPMKKDKRNNVGFGSKKYSKLANKSGYSSIAQMKHKMQNESLSLIRILSEYLREQNG